MVHACRFSLFKTREYITWINFPLKIVLVTILLLSPISHLVVLHQSYFLYAVVVKRKGVILLVIENILAPYSSEACWRENIHFIVFFPYKTV